MADALAKLTRKLIRNDPEAAREILDGLPLADRARVVASFHGADRQDLIFLSAEARELVQALPPPELWVTIKEVGEEDSLDLIRMSAPEQLQHVFDLEWWHKRALDPLAAAYWIMVLNEAGPETTIEWFRQADEELLVAALSRYFNVYKTDPDNQGAEPWRELNNIWTQDDAYYLHFKDPNLAPTIEQFLKAVRAEEPMRYYALMDMVDLGMTPELDEAAYRFRMARLADYGFDDYDEALEIYAPLTDRELDGLSAHPRRESGTAVPLSRPAASAYPLSLTAPLPLFSSALAMVDDAALEDTQLSLAAITNRILIADNMDLQKLASVKEALMKAHAFVEMGLARWSRGDPARAAEILQGQGLTDVFRAGFTRVLLLGRGAFQEKKQGRLAGFPLGIELLGEDGQLIEAVTRPRPLYYAGADDKGAPMLREFRTVDEVARAEQALERGKTLGLMFRDGLGVTADELKTLKDNHHGPAILWETVFLTAVGQALGGAALSFAPLTVADARRALEAMLTEPPRRVRSDVKEQLVKRVDEALRRLAEANDDDRARARDFVTQSLEKLAEETREMDLAELDPRYFPWMVILP
ncbi:MAG TPA: DUF6178 family protein [bacterium]|nr:DUF6178 family protein [bacterium]